MSHQQAHQHTDEDAAKVSGPARKRENGKLLPRSPEETPDPTSNDDMDGISRHDFGGDEPPRKAASFADDYRHLRNCQSNRFDRAYSGR
jgi:hypothetical protein